MKMTNQGTGQLIKENLELHTEILQLKAEIEELRELVHLANAVLSMQLQHPRDRLTDAQSGVRR